MKEDKFLILSFRITFHEKERFGKMKEVSSPLAFIFKELCMKT